MPQKLALLPGHKWARFFRLQLAVKQTAANRARLLQGRKQMGRPIPRLVSIDFEDAYMVPESWTLEDAAAFVYTQSAVYFAVFMDGEYNSLCGNAALPPETKAGIQKLLNDGKISVLPKEGIAKW